MRRDAPIAECSQTNQLLFETVFSPPIFPARLNPILFVVGACMMLGFYADAAQPDPLESYRVDKQAGEFQSAAEHLKQLYQDDPQDLSLEFARLARSGEGHFDAKQASQLYRLAAESLRHTVASRENASQRLLIRIIAATQLAKADLPSDASDVLVRALDECVTQGVSISASRERSAVDLALRLAHGFLTTDRPADALHLYGGLTRYFESLGKGDSLDAVTSLDTAQSEQYALALMGLGWATAGAASHQVSSRKDDPQSVRHDETHPFEVAAQRLMRFVDQFPQHPDAAGSAAMRVYCFSKCLGQPSRSDQSSVQERLNVSIDEYLHRWPEHSTAVSVVKIGLGQASVEENAENLGIDQLGDLESQPNGQSIRDSIRAWISRPAAAKSWPVRFAGQVLLVAGDLMPPDSFESAVARIAVEDDSGQVTADLLAQLVESGRASLARKVAAQAIGVSGEASESGEASAPQAVDAACRWAARGGHWSMLAEQAKRAAVSEDRLKAIAGVPPASHSRLFAESLTRTGQPKDAYRWWSHLVDQSDAVDFTTLLRCAESAVAVASVSEARMRLEQLRRSIESQPASNRSGAIIGSEGADVNSPGSGSSQSSRPQSFWCDLLEGDLAIRSVQFSQARSRFQAVIRSATAPAAVQGRAQWMIGETYFMQKQYSDAINAYRKVDGIDANGSFVAASLVQAGKSFEQLGRTREAGICYRTLISRFANSSYATEAKRRMTALPALDSPSTPLKR